MSTLAPLDPPGHPGQGNVSGSADIPSPLPGDLVLGSRDKDMDLFGECDAATTPHPSSQNAAGHLNPNSQRWAAGNPCSGRSPRQSQPPSAIHPLLKDHEQDRAPPFSAFSRLFSGASRALPTFHPTSHKAPRLPFSSAAPGTPARRALTPTPHLRRSTGCPSAPPGLGSGMTSAGRARPPTAAGSYASARAPGC